MPTTFWSATPSSSSKPEARTGYVRMVLRRLREFDSALGESTYQLFTPALRRSIDESALLGWLPYEIDTTLANAVLAKHGRDGLHGFVLGNSDEAATLGALRPLVEGALRVFGPSPMSLVRVMPELWNVTYRNVSAVAPERLGERQLAIHWVDVCDAVYESPGALGVLYAQSHFPLRVTRTRGAVDPLTLDRGRRRITAVLRW